MCSGPLRWSMSRSATPATAKAAAVAAARGNRRAARRPHCSARLGRPAHTAPVSTRGEHLVKADRGFAVGGGLIARLFAPAFARVLDGSTPDLQSGGIEATLPGWKPAPDRVSLRRDRRAVVKLTSWMALVRLATSGSVGWYKAWAQGEWSSARPGRRFRSVHCQCVALGRRRRAPRGRSAGSMRIAHRLRDNAPRQGQGQHRRPLRPRQ